MAKKRGHFRLMLLLLPIGCWMNPSNFCIKERKKKQVSGLLTRGEKINNIFIPTVYAGCDLFLSDGMRGSWAVRFFGKNISKLNSLVGEQQVYFQATKQSHWFFFFCCRWRDRVAELPEYFQPARNESTFRYAPLPYKKNLITPGRRARRT